MYNVLIRKKPYEDTNIIEVLDSKDFDYIPLKDKLKEANFTYEQIELLDDLLHKLVNRKIEIK